MAVTFATIPASYSPSDNPLKYTFSSNQTAQANFSYKVKTYLNGILVSTDKVFPESGIYAHFDASTIVRYLMPQPTIGTALSQLSPTILNVYLIVTENYGSTPIDYSSATSSTTKTFKAALSDKDFINKDFNATYKQSKWLTNWNIAEPIQVLRGCDVVASMIVDASKTLTLKFYNAAGSLIHTYTTTQTLVMWNLNLKSTLLTSTAGVPDITLVATFTAQIGTSDILTFEYYDDYCNNPFQVSWLNEYGTFDQFLFKHNNQIKSTTETLGYQSQFGYWSGSSFTYSLENIGDKDIIKTIKIEGTLTTAWLTMAEQNWLVECINSVRVVLYDITGDRTFIRITDNQYNYDNDRFVDQINLSINYKVSYNKKSVVL